MEEDLLIRISERLRNLRIDRKITVQKLASEAGVSKGLVSQIENSRTIPSLPVLLKIIRSLNIDLNSFFDSIGFGKRSPDVIVKKAQSYVPFEKENAIGFSYLRILGTQINDLHVDIVLLKLAKNAKRAMVKTNAYEFKFILEGKVEYSINKKKHLLNQGDSLFFDARQPHVPKNVGKKTASLLVVYFFLEPR